MLKTNDSFPDCNPAGDACDHSFDSADEAAVDAVKKLGLDQSGPVIPLYLGFWDVSAFHSPTGKDSRLIIGPAMFCEALGYSDEDIAEDDDGLEE